MLSRNLQSANTVLGCRNPNMVDEAPTHKKLIVGSASQTDTQMIVCTVILCLNLSQGQMYIFR